MTTFLRRLFFAVWTLELLHNILYIRYVRYRMKTKRELIKRDCLVAEKRYEMDK